jgi:hypothetical protein
LLKRKHAPESVPLCQQQEPREEWQQQRQHQREAEDELGGERHPVACGAKPCRGGEAFGHLSDVVERQRAAFYNARDAGPVELAPLELARDIRPCGCGVRERFAERVGADPVHNQADAHAPDSFICHPCEGAFSQYLLAGWPFAWFRHQKCM